MSNNYVLAVLVVFLLGYVVYQEVSRRVQRHRETKAEEKKIVEKRLAVALESRRTTEEQTAARQSALTDALLKLATSMEASATHGSDHTALMAGTVKACEAIAGSVDQLRGVVNTFSTLINAPKPEPQYPDEQLLKPNSEEEAALAHDTFERVLTRGIPLDQAVTEAKEAAEKKMMFSTAELGDNE